MKTVGENQLLAIYRESVHLCLGSSSIFPMMKLNPGIYRAKLTMPLMTEKIEAEGVTEVNDVNFGDVFNAETN